MLATLALAQGSADPRGAAAAAPARDATASSCARLSPSLLGSLTAAATPAATALSSARLSPSLRASLTAAPSAAATALSRGDAVDARYRSYTERMDRLYAVLRSRLETEAPDLLAKLNALPRKPARPGYQVLPRIVPDRAPPAGRPRASIAAYSWPWTERLIEMEITKLDALEADLSPAAGLGPKEWRAVFERIVADYPPFRRNEQMIDDHIQYNRLWQASIASNRVIYDRETAFQQAVLERQAIGDALGAGDDSAWRKACGGIAGVDPSKPRGELEADLRLREASLAREIHEATDAIAPPAFLRVERRGRHVWIVRVPVYTDIVNRRFLRALAHAVESIWHVKDGGEEFRVKLDIERIPPKRLYHTPGCGHGVREGCQPPRAGDPIDLKSHAALFPPGGAVLTTGVSLTHVTLVRCIVVGPEDVPPRVFAHEFGHILGFKDVYFRGYRDLGADGFEVREVVADSDDIMGDPGTGPVKRRHFEALAAKVASR